MAESNVKFAEGLKDVVSGNRVSRAFTGSLILGNTSPSLVSTTSGSNCSSSNSSRAGTPPTSVASHNSFSDVERVSCCTIDDFWKIYDSFKLMDKRKCGSVRRCDFFEATTEHVTLDMRRTLTRGDLHERFRSSAAEMTLEELCQRIWPTATDADQKLMKNWVKLRDASSVLSAENFQGTRQDLKRIFDLLDVDGSQTLSMSELTRARILTKAESQKLMKNWYDAFTANDSCESGKKEGLNLTFNEFCVMTQKHLAEKYAHKDDENDNWEKHCRSAFRVSKAATVMLSAAREGASRESQSQGTEPSDEKTVPRKVHFKTAGLGIKVANQFNRPDRVVMAC